MFCFNRFSTILTSRIYLKNLVGNIIWPKTVFNIGEKCVFCASYKVLMYLFIVLKIYINISTFMSVRPYGVGFSLPIPAIISQNVTNKSCLVCIKSEKYMYILGHPHTPEVQETRRGQAT